MIVRQTKWVIFFGLCLLFSSTHTYAELQLNQVLKAFPEVGQFRPSQEKTLEIGQEERMIQLGDAAYYIRFFMFQVAPEQQHLLEGVSFGQWAQAQGLLPTKSQQLSENFGSLIYFVSSENAQNAGVYFTLSLGPIGNAPTEISLEDVLNQAPSIANFKASEFVFGTTPRGVHKIGGQRYELRYMSYWVDPNSTLRSSSQSLDFASLCKNCHIETLEAQEMDRGYGSLKTFAPTDDLKNQGVHFSLALRTLP